MNIKKVILLALITAFSLTALTAKAQISSSTTKIRFPEITSFTPSWRIEMGSSTRLDSAQLSALIAESPTAKNLASAKAENIFSWNDCPMYLPLEPGEVSYISGFKIERAWIQQPPPELEALDEIQCRICQLRKQGKISNEDAELWTIEVLEEFVPAIVEKDKQIPQTGALK